MISRTLAGSAHLQGGSRRAPQQRVLTGNERLSPPGLILLLSPQDSAHSGSHGFTNLAYDFGSQGELDSAPRGSSSAIFRLLASPQQEQQVQQVPSKVCSLAGVVTCSSVTPAGFLTVDYDPAVVSPRQVALELQGMGLSVECGVRVRVEGMRCQSCVHSIQDHLGSLQGVLKVQVSLQDAAALVLHRPLMVTQQELRDQIEDMGFSATVLDEDPPWPELDLWQAPPGSTQDPPRSSRSATIWIRGMTCASCVQSVEGRLAEVGGVHSASVSLQEGTATVNFDPCLTEPEKLRAAVEDVGFDASLTG